MSDTVEKTKNTKAIATVEEIDTVDISNANDALEETLMDLVYAEPFYANLTMNMRRKFTMEFPTLAVSVTDEIDLLINPHFFCALKPAERVDCIKHECLHVINNHFVRFRDLEPKIYENKKRSMAERYRAMKGASLLNEAADYAINEYLPNLPREVKIFGKDGKAMREPDKYVDDKGKEVDNPNAGKIAKARLLFVQDLKKKIPNLDQQQNLEYYYEFLKQQQEQDEKNQKGKGQGDGDGGKGTMTLDDHSHWFDSDLDDEAITDKVKEIVNKAVDQTGTKHMGKLPMNVIQALDALNHVPKDWRQDIQRFVARQEELLFYKCRKKRDRRYGIIYPGTRTEPKMHLAVGFDASGSVDDESAMQFNAEIGRLHKMGIKITVIEFDSQVNAVYEYDPREEFKLHGRGGTAFAPMFEEAKKHDIDGLICLTDGGNWDTDQCKKPKFPVLWALLPNCSSNFSWGAKTVVEVKKRVRR
jgi:predicted metal-dependent peptidase